MKPEVLVKSKHPGRNAQASGHGRPARSSRVALAFPSSQSAEAPASRRAEPCANLIVNLVPPLARMLRSEIAPAMGFGVSLAQFNMLSALAFSPVLNNGELADSLGVSVPVATRQVDNLVEAGLVARLRQNRDRRHVRLALTEKGQAIHQKVRDRVGTALLVKLDALTDHDRQILEDGLLILGAMMEADPSRTQKPQMNSASTKSKSRLSNSRSIGEKL
jgi:DNA-binding MarR family transcriptional regulator